MHKIFLIVKREYISRVRNKTFILTTLLTPLFFVLLIGGATFFSTQRNSTYHKIAVIDDNGFFKNSLKSSETIVFDFPSGVDTNNYISKGYTDILLLPKMREDQKAIFVLRSAKSMGLALTETVEKQINTAMEEQKLQERGINQKELDSLRNASHVAELNTQQQSGDEVKESSEGLAYGIGYGSGLLIYITMLTYGMMVFKGVSEEKINRISEVIISSVRPFQLMMGKIIGIGLVGLTQFLLWIVLFSVLYLFAHSLISHETLEQVKLLQQNGGIMSGSRLTSISESAQKLYDFQRTMSTANWSLIIGCFLFFFIGGYLFYAALFAAVGSVVDDTQGSQGLTIPITMPLIFSFFIMTGAVRAPDSSLALWASIIPFTSPSVMMARIAYGVPGTVPYWQLIVSMVSLVAGFLFTTWMAGKIYRTGLLLYGKKVTWKEMVKWAFYSK